MSAVTVADLMTPNPMTVAPTDSIGEVRRIMVERRVRHIVVVDHEGVLLGIVNQEDVLRAVWRLSTDGDRQAWTDAPIHEAMGAEVGPTKADKPVTDAARRMLAGKHTALAVTDDAERPTGILTEADFLRWALREMA